MAKASRRGQRPTPLTKLTPPRLPDVVERARLYRLLDRARKRPIVWITAPPGFGKTTLIASYLRARKLPSLWYQVDEGDADLATFFHYLGLAVHQAAPRIRKPLPHLTPEYRQGLPTFTRRFFEELYGGLKPPAVLVFDNYQDVSSDSTLHEMVAVGVGDVPAGISVIVISRVPPPPPFACLQADQKIHFFEEETLRLTEQESRAIVRLHMKTEPRFKPLARLERLHEKLQGWVAGLILLLEQAKSERLPDALATKQTPQVIFDYLAREVVKGLSPEVQFFLLKTAFLPEMTATIAAQLTGLASAGDVLADLYQSRYFTERRAAPEFVYQYHPLFREFLLARAKTILPQDDVQTIRRSAASLLEHAGRIEEAVALYREAGYLGEFVRLILARAPVLLSQGRAQTLEGWLKQVPAERYEQEPWLHYWLGSCLLSVAPVECEGNFERAFEGFKAQGNIAGALMAWAGIVSSIRYSWLDVSRLDPWIDTILDLLPSDASMPSREIEVQVTFCMVTALMTRRPQASVLRPWVNRAKTLLKTAADVEKHMFLSGAITDVFAWLGDLVSAEKYMNMIQATAESETAPPLNRLIYYLDKAVLAWHCGDAQGAIQIAKQGLELAQTTGVHMFDAAILPTCVYGALFQNDLVRAAEYLTRIAPMVTDPKHLMRGNFLLMQAWLARLKGELAKAWDLIQEGFKLKWMKGTFFAEALQSYAAAELLHGLGHDKQARQYLNRVKVIGQDMASFQLQFMVNLLEVRFTLDQGKEEKGLAILQQALAIGKGKGFYYFPWWLPKMMARLCARALEANIEVAYVQDLIRKTRLVPDGQASVSEAWPWPAKITTLGRFALSVDGQPMSVGRKVQRRPLALLKAIIAFGGREVPETQLTDALWPESEGDTAHEAFATTLHRLRKLLRHEQIIELRDGKVTLNDQACWVDAWAFDHLQAEAEAANRNENAEQGVKAAEQTFRLYHGPFLPDEKEDSWTEPLRARLQRKFIRLVEVLSDRCRAKGESQEAIGYLDQGLDREPLAEPLYQRLMTYLREERRQPEAQSVYERCRVSFLKAGINPSPEIERLAKSL